jgi:hypothetical protein
MDRPRIVELSVSASSDADVAVFDTVMDRARDWLLPRCAAPHPEINLDAAGFLDLVTEREDLPLVIGTAAGAAICRGLALEEDRPMKQGPDRPSCHIDAATGAPEPPLQ